MRASIGKAVIDIAAPMVSTACVAVTPSFRNPPARSMTIARPPPSANGATTPGHRHPRRAPRMSDEHAGSEFQADREHVQRKTDLTAHIQWSKRVGREEGLLNAGGDPAEERRTDQKTCQHFRDNLRLSEVSRGQADCATHQQDACDLKKEKGHQCGV